MQSRPDAELIFEYAEHSSEAAFNELVLRHTNLVYSAAVRQSGSPQVAADVTQLVFVALARNARALSSKLDATASIAGWLCRTTRNVCLNQIRNDMRRRSREIQAMEQIQPNLNDSPAWEVVRPVLDAAMSELSEADQEAVVLRFFNNHDLDSVGRMLGVSADAAQKRVARALERLRARLVRRGITTTAASLTGALSAGAVQSAPAGLASAASHAALLGTALNTSLIGGVMKVSTMTLMQKGLVGTAMLAMIGTTTYQRVQVSRLREQNRALAAQQEEFLSARESAVQPTAFARTRHAGDQKSSVRPPAAPQALQQDVADGSGPTDEERAALGELARRASAGE